MMEGVVLIKWFEISKVRAQGNEGVESPQVMKIEKTPIFERRKAQVV